MEITITLRIIEENEQGYVIQSAEEATELIGDIGGTISQISLIDTNNNETIRVSIDDNYSFLSLYRDVCSAIGVSSVLAVETDCPAFPMLIELGDNYLISIDDYNTSLSKVLRLFDSQAITVYLLIILGKGEVYRGDGIRMHIAAEPGIRHNYAHVHVDGKDGRNATVVIEKGVHFRGDLNRKEKRIAAKIIEDNIDVLQEIWKKRTIEGISIDVDYKLGRISITNR